MTAVSETTRKHSWNATPITWSQWKLHWERTTNEEMALGLLHFGLKTRILDESEQLERLSLYLDIADGHRHTSALGEFRIRRKAFQCLVSHFEHVSMLMTFCAFPPEGMMAVLRFFRPAGDEEGSGLYNVEYRDDAAKSRDVAMWKMNHQLRTLCWELWMGEYGYRGVQLAPETESFLDRCGPQVIEIFHAYGNGELEGLVVPMRSYDPDTTSKVRMEVLWHLFTEPCREKLLELALRKGETLEAALLAGSSAAKVLVLVNAALAERERAAKAAS